MKPKSQIKIDAKQMKSKNNWGLDTQAKDFSKYDFWHYTSLETADKIIDGLSFHCSNLDQMNDLHEAERHRNYGEFIHALCFCNSNTEKIPMWYLYAGMSGNGASIGITPGEMQKFIKKITTVKGCRDGEDGKETQDELLIDRDFDLEYGWIFYETSHAEEATSTKIRYRSEWFRLEDVRSFEKDNYFIKDYPWEYEREFRILFKNKTSIPYKKIIVNFTKEQAKRMKLMLAPELSKDGLKTKHPQLYASANEKLKSIKESELYIKMDLVNRNRKEILENIRSIVDTPQNAENAVACLLPQIIRDERLEKVKKLIHESMKENKEYA